MQSIIHALTLTAIHFVEASGVLSGSIDLIIMAPGTPGTGLIYIMVEMAWCQIDTHLWQWS